MASSRNRKPVPGSHRVVSPNAKVVGDVDSQERIEITVVLRPRGDGAGEKSSAAAAAKLGAKLPEKRKYISREAFAQKHGADPRDMEKVESFAREHNLTMVRASIPERTIKIAGTVADMMAAFSVKLKMYAIGKTAFRGRTGAVFVPKEIADIVRGVFGFDTRPMARPHIRRVGALKAAKISPRASKRPSARPSYPPEVAKLYNFPKGLDGTGQSMAIIELNDPNEYGQNGTGFDVSDLKAYFKKLKMAVPKITAVGVDGGANLPNVNPDADGEVMLDVEVAGSIAPKADIYVYFAPNTSRGFIDALSAAVHDTVRKPSVVSLSWGGPEDPPYNTQQMLNSYHQVLQDAAALGVTVCCSVGDNGSSDLPKSDGNGNPLRDAKPHVDHPASDPLTLSCGGTKLLAAQSKIFSESAWNEGDKGGAGGGGVSNYFALPDYQKGLGVPLSPKGFTGRGVPDVSCNADPKTGYKIMVGGKIGSIGGTSASAPLWAALITLINQRLASLGKGSCGFVNQILYKTSNAFHDVVTGNNDIDGSLGKYQAAAGWDACTGQGTPDGTRIMNALGG